MLLPAPLGAAGGEFPARFELAPPRGGDTLTARDERGLGGAERGRDERRLVAERLLEGQCEEHHISFLV